MSFESPLRQQVLPISEPPLTPTHLTTCSPKTPLSGKKTAAEILAAFSPVSQSKRNPQPWVSPSSFSIAMSEKRTMRRKERISYHISDDSDSVQSQSAADSTFSTPQKTARSSQQTFVDLDEDSEIEPEKTPPPRVSSAGHSLRQHQNLHLSLRAQENGDRQRVTKRRKPRKPSRKSVDSSNSKPSPLARTARNQIRNEIATETTRKRNNFFVAKKDYFLPLLPDNNYITRLAEERSHVGEDEMDLSIPYEAIEHQPEGYATPC